MLSFYEMACLLEKIKATKVSEAITLSPEEQARSAKLAAMMRAKKGAAAPAVTTPPEQAAVETPPAPAAADSVIAAAQAAQAGLPATSSIRRKKPRPTQGPSGVDPNDPNNKTYAPRLRGVKGGAIGKSISKQMTDVPDQNRQRQLLARLADKVQQTNSIIRNYPTMAFFANIAMAEQGYGPLKHLGAEALKTFESDPNRTPESDAALTKPFAFALQRGNFEKENKFGDLSAGEQEPVKKIYIPNPKTMVKIIGRCKQLMDNAQHYERLVPKAAAAPAAPKAAPSGPSPDDVNAVKAATGALPQRESQEDGWMEVHNLIEHWNF